MKIIDLFDSLISHNEIIALWIDTGEASKTCMWRGMGHQLPDEYKNKSVVRIFGTIPSSISEADSINILYTNYNKEIILEGTFSYSGTRVRNANKRYYGDKFASALLKGNFPIPIFISEKEVDRKFPIGFVTKIDYNLNKDLCTCQFILNNLMPVAFSKEQFQRNLYICPALVGTTEYIESEDTYNVTGDVDLQYFYISETPASFTFIWEEINEREISYYSKKE